MSGEYSLELEPVSAAVLASLEHERRERVAEKGKCGVGCREVDECVLLGGLERGVVVGVSSEEEEFGVLLSLQLIARTLCEGLARGKAERALVVSTQPTGTVARALRDAVAGQVRCGEDGVVRDVLSRVSIARVFDVTGLSEVLGELDIGPRAPPSPPGSLPRERGDEAVGQGGVGVREEIPDSDEDTSPFPSPSPRVTAEETSSPGKRGGAEPPLPDIILVTHFSTLLTTLFTHTEKTAAHNTLHLLSSRLRYLSRSLPSNPLVILANSTAASPLAPAADPTHHHHAAAVTSSPPHRRGPSPPRRPDPTLRSVLSAPGPYAGTWQKPSFGMVFTQFLDLHLLCTKVPRTRGDAEGAVTGMGRGREVWVVEVLLDEGGVWEGRAGERRGRERRWGVVDLVGGRVVDAFGGGGV